MLPKLFVCATLIALCVFLANVAAFGQGDLDTVTFSGKVTDANGLPVVGATVTATLVDTGESRTVTSDDQGKYKLIGLKPGRYVVKAASGGFAVLETQPVVTV